MKQLHELLSRIEAQLDMYNVFNPWKDYDKIYDVDFRAPSLRKKHLSQFLKQRLGSAQLIVVAEALGYQGGKFSGIPMTSERIICNHHRSVKGNSVLEGGAERTSKPGKHLRYKSQITKGFNEPTATIVWKEIIKSGVNPNKIVLWNSFPFHPYEQKKGLLSNRTPTEEEIQLGREYLTDIIDLFPNSNLVALGTIAKQSLDVLGRTYCPIPHPSTRSRQVATFKLEFSKLLARIE